MFLIFSVMEHIEIKCFKNARTSLYVHCLSVLIVSENKCFNTAESLQITTMNKKKKIEQ